VFGKNCGVSAVMIKTFGLGQCQLLFLEIEVFIFFQGRVELLPIHLVGHNHHHDILEAQHNHCCAPFFLLELQSF